MTNVYCVRLGNSFNFQVLKTLLLANKFRIEKEGDVLVVYLNDNSISFFFPFGTVVYWGCGEEEVNTLNSLVQPSVIGYLVKSEFNDEFEVEESLNFRVENDTLYLPKDFDIYNKLAVSYAIAQSTGISDLETKVEETEKLIEYLPKELAENGKTSLSDKKLKQLIGTVLQKKHDINLEPNLTITPDYFWEYPETETFYHKVSRNLEITSRIALMNKKVEVLQETLAVLRDESNARHSATLEWIVIWLIVIEVCFTLWDNFGHFLTK